MVNTFVVSSTKTDPNYVRTMSLLDNRRLGKQRVEAYQLLNILEDIDYIISQTHCCEPILQVDSSELALSFDQQATKYLNRCQAIKDVIKYYKSSKQRFAFDTETKQYTNITCSSSDKRYRQVTLGFASHPAVRMWVGYIRALKIYINASIAEWVRRGFKNTMQIYDVDIVGAIHPWWRMYRTSPVILSHICSLKRKEPESYTHLGISDDMKKWQYHGYSWPPNLEHIHVSRLMAGEYIDPQFVTVEIMKSK